ncbi:MAG: hypothetical protein ACQETD_01110 [Pseudomonadota bacterium]
MGRHVFLSVLGVTLVAVVLGVFVIPGKEPGPRHFPWQITTTEDGGSRVLGVELGRSSLGEAEVAFGEPAEVSLFVQESGEKVVEAYFDNVDVSGIRARIVVVMGLDETQLEAMYERGVRLANMGGGRRKVTLSDEDLLLLKSLPIHSMTYIPRSNLDEAVVEQRFGQPAERIAEPDSKTVHWLYPEKGLDVALNPEEDEVLQYVRPDQFEVLLRPLRERGSE